MPRGSSKSGKKELPPKKGCKKIKELGRGSYGTVYSYQLHDGKEYAVKISSSDLYSSDIREIAIIRYLAPHPTIIEALAVGFRSKRPYMAMEQGKDLGALISYYKNRKQTIPAEKLKFLIYQLFCGIDYMHSKDVMHRDLKPQNLLLFPGDLLKIADFGLAKGLYCMDVEKPTTEVVTIWYRAPEVILELPHDTPIDIWAAGCIVYELATGKVLFQGSTEVEMMRKFSRKLGMLKKEDFPLANWRTEYNTKSNTPEGFENIEDLHARKIIEQCLRYIPSRRPRARDIITSSWFDSVRILDYEVPDADRKSCDGLLEASLFQSLSLATNLGSSKTISPRSNRGTSKESTSYITSQTHRSLVEFILASFDSSDIFIPTSYFYTLDLLRLISDQATTESIWLFACACMYIATVMRSSSPIDIRDLARYHKSDSKSTRNEISMCVVDVINSVEFRLLKSTCRDLYVEYKKFYHKLPSDSVGIFVMYAVSFDPFYYEIDPVTLALLTLKIECNYYGLKFLHHSKLEGKDRIMAKIRDIILTFRPGTDASKMIYEKIRPLQK